MYDVEDSDYIKNLIMKVVGQQDLERLLNIGVCDWWIEDCLLNNFVHKTR